MFVRLSTLLPVAALAAVAAARALNGRQSDFCNTGEIVCCDDTAEPTSDAAIERAAKAGVSLAKVQGPVGLACSPYSGVGVGDNGGSCSQAPLCCFDNTWGLISVGCSPIGVSL